MKPRSMLRIRMRINVTYVVSKCVLFFSNIYFKYPRTPTQVPLFRLTRLSDYPAKAKKSKDDGSEDGLGALEDEAASAAATYAAALKRDALRKGVNLPVSEEGIPLNEDAQLPTDDDQTGSESGSKKNSGIALNMDNIDDVDKAKAAAAAAMSVPGLNLNAPGVNIPKPPQVGIPIPKPFPKLPEPFDPLAWLMALINMLMSIIKPILEGILLPLIKIVIDIITFILKDIMMLIMLPAFPPFPPFVRSVRVNCTAHLYHKNITRRATLESTLNHMTKTRTPTLEHRCFPCSHVPI